MGGQADWVVCFFTVLVPLQVLFSHPKHLLEIASLTDQVSLALDTAPSICSSVLQFASPWCLIQECWMCGRDTGINWVVIKRSMYTWDDLSCESVQLLALSLLFYRRPFFHLVQQSTAHGFALGLPSPHASSQWHRPCRELMCWLRKAAGNPGPSLLRVPLMLPIYQRSRNRTFGCLCRRAILLACHVASSCCFQ